MGHLELCMRELISIQLRVLEVTPDACHSCSLSARALNIVLHT